MARNPNKKRCKAKSKQTGERCKNWAKPGYDVCHYHGAGGGAPPEKMKGNKNAVTTGEYETIWLDTLDDDERVLFDVIKTDVLHQIEEEIKLMTIRERRMMQRIQKLKEQDYITVELSKLTSVDARGKSAQATTRQEHALVQIQAIEEALTRVQEKKARLLELKYKITTATGENEEDNLASLAAAIKESAKLVKKYGQN